MSNWSIETMTWASHWQQIMGEFARMRHREIVDTLEMESYRSYYCVGCGLDFDVVLAQVTGRPAQLIVYMETTGPIHEHESIPIFCLDLGEGKIFRREDHYNDWVCGKLRVMR